MFYKIFKFSILYLFLSSMLVSGCVPVLIGTGLVTGYAAIRDTASGNVEASFDELWSTSLRVLGEKAEIVDQNQEVGLIKAKYGKNDIAVRIKELTEHSYNLKVTCRKFMAVANLSLAQEFFTKIVRTLSAED